MSQLELFPSEVALPGGFIYRSDFITPTEEDALLHEIQSLHFQEIRMHGVVAKRRALHFGRGYELEEGRLTDAPEIPDFLLPLRERIGQLASRDPEEFAEALILEYPRGAPIGWHRDAPPFEFIAGLSLLSDCTMHFRPWHPDGLPAAIERLTQRLERRSAYIIQGESRTAWEHHIPPAKERRYSITFRTLRSRG